jgi:hypothetical protein
MNWGHFWWNDVHGARAFLRAITEQIISGKSIFLTNATPIPWKEDMREVARDIIEQSVATSIVFYNAAEIQSSGTDLGNSLLNRFTDKVGYRPHLEKWWEYTRRVNAFDSKRFWIYDVDISQIGAWADAARHLKGQCSFVIESESGDAQVGQIESMQFSEYTTEYDDLFLAARAFAEREDLLYPWQRYMSDLAAQLYPGQAERIVDFAEQISITQPIDQYDSGVNPQAIWTAQLKNGYHLIEQARLSFIRKHKYNIQNCLPEIQFREEVVNPFDAELGLLWHLTERKREEMNKRRLILTKEDYEELRFLHDMRNKLAHSSILTPPEMTHLLKGRTFEDPIIPHA